MSTVHWLGNLAAWSIQAAALIAGGSAAAWVFRVRVPRVRLAYWHVLLAICLLLPAVEPWRRAPDAQIAITTSASHQAPTQQTPPYSLPWRRILLIVLASGCAARGLWLAAGFARLRRWRRDGRPMSPLPAHLDRLRASLAPQAEFLLSSSVSGPVTFGLRRPLVVLPDRFAELPVDIQEAVACHELLHVRRRDWFFTVAEESIRAVLWFHPAVWWLISQAQLAREQTVDRDVVALTNKRAQYLKALLALAGNGPVLDLAPATLFLRKRHLRNRVALLLKEVSMSKRSLISFCAASSGVVLAAGWLALHTFPLQAAPLPQEQSQSNLLHSVPPKYPQAAKDKHIQGVVTLEVKIDEKGHVSDARVLSGPEELRSAALEAVLQWHYSPEAMNLPATTQVNMNFTLGPEGKPAPPPPASVLPDGKRVVVRNIAVEGLAPAARDELLARLPVHTGDTLDAAGMHDVVTSATAFDEHLRVALLLDPTDENSGSLRIELAPPGPPPPPKIRVGGNVQQTKLISQVRPVYPAEAKAQGIHGLVRLEATLGKDGKVENLKVLEGDPALVAAAMDAVRQWQYQTTLLNGDPVEVLTQIDVNFTLAK